MKLSELSACMAVYQVILEPDQNIPEWWAGAPSVVRTADGAFYMTARMREGNSPRGKRGYEIRILKSQDGIHFSPCHAIRREDAHVLGFERAALVIDPATHQFKLYGCTGMDHGWVILKWDDADAPELFKPDTARSVLSVPPLQPEHAGVSGYKDPVVFWDNNQWHMYVIGTDCIERIHHFTSQDGEKWTPGVACPVLPNTGWHTFYTRPASVLPLDVGYLFVYEGSHHTWNDPVYNIATGLAYSPDLKSFYDLTPDEPLLTSTTPGPYHTWRYSHWLPVDDMIYVYFEAARPNATNEIRLAMFSRACLNSQ